MYIAAFSAEMYFQEANQRLNASVASFIAAKVRPIAEGKVDRAVLSGLFDDVMVINPSVEVYLLDTSGTILAYSAPDSVIKRGKVSLVPVRDFLRRGANTLIMGDDPRGVSREKSFSAAELRYEGKLEGYLYVILGGEEYDSAMNFLLGSYILRLGARTMGITIVLAALLGLLIFRLITRGLGKTIAVVREFQQGEKDARIPPSSVPEINELASAFNDMADTIARNIEEIHTMDNLRRDLVANVSHDLRTPLVSIHGYVETILMKDATLGDEERRKHLRTVLQSTEKLKKLVEELFELSKLEAKQAKPALEQFSLAELVQDVVQKHMILAESRNVEIIPELPRDLPFVVADIALIERVFQNLLDNAIKYTPEHGSIRITLRREGAGVNVHIADTGEGIPPEELPHIFDTLQEGRALRLRPGIGRRPGAGHRQENSGDPRRDDHSVKHAKTGNCIFFSSPR